jgi:class 3 adenylate cyclase/tetratricopeptide (TPR) repeat protein
MEQRFNAFQSMLGKERELKSITETPRRCMVTSETPRPTQLTLEARPTAACTETCSRRRGDMRCHSCQSENRESINFCENCGARMEIRCPACNADVPPGKKFCGECGHALQRPEPTAPVDFLKPQSYTPKFLADKILKHRSSIEGERKVVTVLFADVAGYTAMSEKLDPEDVHQIMDGCFSILMDAIHHHEGTINQFTGDGVMALFGAPIAHEDHAQRACRAAITVQDRMASYAEKLQSAHNVEFKLRIGINTGPVIVGAIGDDLRMDYTALGDTTNLAARIQQTTEPGRICLSQATRHLVQDYFVYESQGEVCLKGKAEPQSLYCLEREKIRVRTRFDASLMRGVTELVGRRLEMKTLQAMLERAKQCDTQIVDVVGEAGVGKSRFVYEFRQRLGEGSSFVTGACIQHGTNINFLPLIDIARDIFSAKEDVSEEEVGRHIEAVAKDSLATMIPFYRNLLSLRVDDPSFNALQPEGLKYGTFEALKSLLLTMAARKPLVVFIEDVHWIDKISEEFFTFFSRSMLGHPILMLSAYRPEGSPPWAHGAAHYQRLVLETLSSESSIRLVHNILGGLRMETALEQRIAKKAGGNPFFVEEIVRELLDRGDIRRKGNRYVAARPIEGLDIPNTVQGVLAARMDRLNEEIKRTMQVASVIGRDFAFRILHNIMKMGDDLKNHMNNLIGLEILYEKTLYPELQYIFKHALTQEVAYHSLLRQKRQEIHNRIGRAIEILFADRLEEHYEIIAHHYVRSGNAYKAIDYLLLAGEKSNRHMAAKTASDFFDKALAIVQDQGIQLDRDKEIRLHRGRALVALGIGAVGNAMASSRKTAELGRDYGMTDYEVKSLADMAVFMYMWPDKAEADNFYSMGLERARELGDQALESFIMSFQGIRTVVMDGQPYKGSQIIHRANRIATATKNPQAIGAVAIPLAYAERWLGRPQKANEITNDLVGIMKSSFSITMIGNLISVRGNSLAETGCIEEAIALIEDAIDSCEKYGTLFRVGAFYNSLGYCYAEIHQPRQAIPVNEKSAQVAQSLMAKFPMGILQQAEINAHANVNLMENHFDLGEVDAAWTRIQKFREESKGDVYNFYRDRWQNRMHYLEAQMLILKDALDEAETIIRTNLKYCRQEHSRKREGAFCRLLGEVQLRRRAHDDALQHFNGAIAVLKEVGNPRQLWQAHASLGAAYDSLERRSEASEQWGVAAATIRSVAEGIADAELKERFLEAPPIMTILSKS